MFKLNKLSRALKSRYVSFNYITLYFFSNYTFYLLLCFTLKHFVFIFPLFIYFAIFIHVKHIDLPPCMKCAIETNLPCLPSNVSEAFTATEEE